MPHQRKKRGKEKQKKRGGEKAKGKRCKADELSRKKLSRNFAFCACPNFESCNLASGTKASPVLDLQTTFWTVWILFG